MAKSKKIKLRTEIVLLSLILLFVAVPYVPRAYKTLSEWNENQANARRISKQIKADEATVKRQEQLLQKYGITHLELYDDAVSYLQAEARIKEIKAKYGSCESPISPTPTAKPKSNYFNIDWEKYRPSSIETEYEQFISYCDYIEKHENTFNAFDSEVTKINLLIAENSNSTDTVIQKLVQSLNAKVKNYQQVLFIGEKTK